MVTILCGKSASGKDTLLRELIKDGYFQPLISTTTRPMRDGEVQDKDYHFISHDDFMMKLQVDIEVYDLFFLQYFSFAELIVFAKDQIHDLFLGLRLGQLGDTYVIA